MNVVRLALMTQMMDQKINSAGYVKVLKRTHSFLLSISPSNESNGKNTQGKVGGPLDSCRG